MKLQRCLRCQTTIPGRNNRTFCSQTCYHAHRNEQTAKTVGMLPSITEVMEFVDIRDAASCWSWTGYKVGGYGKISFNKVRYTAHRLIWQLVNNRQPPEKMEICHHCDNPSCCNPEHLYLGTHADNMHDMAIRKRQKNIRKGEKHLRAVLTNKTVNEIRTLYNTGKYSQSELAKKFAISRAAIQHVVKGRVWRDPNLPVVDFRFKNTLPNRKGNRPNADL